MKNFIMKKTAKLLLPVSAMTVLTLAGQIHAAETKPIVNDSENKVVHDGSGDCVLSMGGRNAVAPECGLMLVVEQDPKPVDGDADGDGVLDSRDHCLHTPRGVQVDARGCALDTDGDGVPDYKDKCPGTSPGVKVDMNGCEIIGNITINLVNDEFDFDSARLKPAMKSALDDVVSRVKASTGDEYLVVIGHTDSTGPEVYNQRLSERRARSVADYMVSRGISASRITTQGMGESQPVASNGTRAGRSKNRRAEIRTR
ncbi:MAG: OmpA family protein [Sedimenticola sp.]